MSASAEILPAPIVRRARHPRRAPESLAEAVTALDRRTRLGKGIAAFRAELVAHVGGLPPATQAALIEPIVQHRLRLTTIDRAFADGGAMSPHDSRTYLALSNSLGRLLRQLDDRGSRSSDSAPGAAQPNGFTGPVRAPLGGCTASSATAIPARPASALNRPDRGSETPLAQELAGALSRRRAAAEQAAIPDNNRQRPAGGGD